MHERIEEKIEIAVNVEAQVTYTHIGSGPAPDDGFDWPEELDWPRVVVRLALPAKGDRLVGYLQNPDVQLLGEALTKSWGSLISSDGKPYRYAEVMHNAPTVRLAYERCKVDIVDAMQILRIGVDRRNARIGARNKLISAGRVDSPFKHKD